MQSKTFHIIALLLAVPCLAVWSQEPSPALQTSQAPETAPWSLERCITHAVTHNLQIRQQEKTVESQQIALNTAQSSRLPSLQASLSQSFSFGRGLTIDNTYTNRNTMNSGGDLSASVPIYTGGQITHNIRSNRLELNAALADLERARQDLSVQVASSYLEVLYQQSLLDIARQQTELSQAQVRRMELLLENGKTAETNVAEARSTHASDLLQLTQAQNAYQLALLTLSQLLELPTPDGFSIETPDVPLPQDVLLESPDEIYLQAVGQKPVVEASRLRVEEAKEGIATARSGHLPQLSLNAGLSTNYYKVMDLPAATFSDQLRDNFSKYVGVNLSIPIFDRNSTRNRVRTARVQYEGRQLALEQVQKDLFKEIQQAYYNALAAQSQCISSEAAQAAAQTAFELVTSKYENGKATATEYQESKLRLQRAQADHAYARYTFLFRQKILDFYRGIDIK